MKCVLCFCFLIFLAVEEICCYISYQNIFEDISLETKESLSLQCQKDVNSTAIATQAFWLMVDSSSRIPSINPKGNAQDMGNYDKCLEIEEVETKFCHATLTIHSPFGDNPNQISPLLKQINTEAVGIAQKATDFSVAQYFCVLQSCDANDLNIIFGGFVQFDETQCLSKDSGPALDGLAITAIVIFSIIAVITVLSTIYDVHLFYSKSVPFYPIAIAFSLFTNGKKLFRLRNTQQLQCLNGIKSLSMLWVVLGHVYAAYTVVPLDNNLVEVYNWLHSPFSQYITAAGVSVDTFLVIGGFLIIYTFHTSMDKGTKFNVPLYYFHRYLRLTPALAAMILAHVALFKYFGSGPLWQTVDSYLISNCQKFWWAALLYIQNYVNANKCCVQQSWYLCVDMQLFLISPLILVMMRRWSRWGHICLSIASILSIVASFLIGWFYKLNGQQSGNIDADDLDNFMIYYYVTTHTRMSPYLVGIMLGQVVYQLKASKNEIKINIILVWFGWVLSLGSMATCMYGGHTLQFTEYDRLANSFYISLMRPTWSIAICWVIFACVMGYGGPINYFLSLPVFQIMSRLCYSIYLVHYSFIFLTNFSIRAPLHFSDYYAFHKFWGDMAFSVALAVVWTLVFESPIIVLEKVLLGRGSKSKTSNKSKA